MTNNNSTINDLLFLLVEDALDQDGIEYIIKWLSSGPEARRHYCEFINDYVAMKHQINSMIEMDEEVFSISGEFDAALWTALADVEKTAPEIEIPQEKPAEIARETAFINYKTKPKFTKWNAASLMAVAATILFMFLFIKFAPPRGGGIEIATLTDTINAEWSDKCSFMQKGVRLVSNSDQLMLREGMAEILFDNRTRVVVEAPAEFEILANDRIGMAYGKVYVAVSKEAIGFSVYTSNSKIIDMGTEFGVQADIDGDTKLYVVKGKTLLMAGGETSQTNIEVNEGAAKKVSGSDSTVMDIECEHDKFVRKIDSENNRIWRGENLSLASIAAGHDGFHKVISLKGLNPDNGEYVVSVIQKDRKSNGAYNLVTDSDFIDGVFVPDGELGPVQITSSGQTFDCPDTSGIFTHEIAAYKGPVENQKTTINPIMINGQEVINDPILMLHSNSGITFDLQAIRKSLPQLDLESLRAIVVPTKEYNPDIDVWILVDGQIKYEKQIVADDREPVSVNIEFGPQDRFLTLIVTDGLRPDDNDRSFPYENDFLYFINPEIMLIEVQ